MPSSNADSDSSSSSEPHLLIEKYGSSRGEPTYIVTKHVPAHGHTPAKAYSIRCSELGKEALGNYKAEEGGCSQTQFYNETKDLRCIKCGMDFNKEYLRSDLYMEVRGVPE